MHSKGQEGCGAGSEQHQQQLQQTSKHDGLRFEKDIVRNHDSCCQLPFQKRETVDLTRQKKTAGVAAN